MAGLTFVGLGLSDEADITLKGLRAIQEADVVFAEFYTSPLTDADPKKLEEAFSKKIRILSRSEVEDGKVILDAARVKNAALIVAGDPMMATTHEALRIEAADLGINVRIIHNASIVSAAPGLLGLQNYKFGRTATIPYPKPNFSPESYYDTIHGNMAAGLHTLVLLDIDQENGRYMSASDGIRLLLDIGRKRKDAVFADDTLVCVVARAGSQSALLRAGAAKKLASEDFGAYPHCIIVPAKLHYMEAEALVKLAGAPKSIEKTNVL